MTLINNSDRTWENLGARNPYWAVLSEPEFDKSALDKEERQRFFETGEAHVSWALERASRHFDGLESGRALDFGCGVGRLVLPLSRHFRHVTGIDISPDMLRHAADNCLEAGQHNVDFVPSSDDLEELEDPFDFVHSLIVFQHIPVERGMKLLTRLMQLTRPDGVMMVHLVIDRELPLKKKIAYQMRRTLPLVNTLANLVQGKPLREPMMQMNVYNLNRVMRLFFENGFGHLYVHQHHDLWYPGVVLFAQKSPPVHPA